MQEVGENTGRKLKVTCDRTVLTSLVDSALRSKGVPMVLFGGDLIRGAVFDMMDHPENSIEESVGRAYFFSKLPGRLSKQKELTTIDIERGYDYIYEAIEASGIKHIPWIPYSEPDRDSRKRAIVEKHLKIIAYDVFKSYCYSVMFHHFEDFRYSFDTTFGMQLVKDMVYKKLVADESTEECMYAYAYRKEFNTSETVSLEDMKAKITKQLEGYCKETGKTPYEIACDIVDSIYEKHAS